MPNVREIYATLRRQRHPARFLSGLLLSRTGASRYFVMQREGVKLRFFPSSMSLLCWADPAARAEDHAFFRDALRTGDVVVDVGANVGTLALSAARLVGPIGKVYAIEAHPRIFSYLRGNAKLNGFENIELYNVALDARDGVVRFSDDRHDDGANAVVASETPAPFEVAARRLDDVVPGNEAIALLKLDVEGYEKFVLEGGPGVLARTSCVYFEAYDAHVARFGYTVGDLFRLFEGAGFRVFRPENGRRLRPVDVGEGSPRCDNFVALRDVEAFERRTGYRRRAG